MLKLEERKNTTKTGLEALEDLMTSFKFTKDVAGVVGSAFACVGDIGGNEEFLWTENGEFRIENGELELWGWAERYGYEPRDVRFNSICKIDFGGAVKSLETAIERYNVLCREKDVEIKKFMDLCKAYQADA